MDKKKEPKKPITCPKCDYTWTPRVNKPVSCPECKQRLGRMKG